MGLCMGSITWLVPVQQLEMFVEQLKGVGVVAPPGISPAQFVRIFYTTGGVMAAAVGCVLIALAVFVRRASRTGVITATIVCALVTVYFVFEVLNGARLALSGNPALIAAGCFTLIPLSLFGLITLWLVQLLRALPAIDAARRQYQSQYYQSQQQQWQYNANQPAVLGYGGYPPPGQMPVAPPTGQGYAMPPQPPATIEPSQNPKPESPKPESSPNDKMPE